MNIYTSLSLYIYIYTYTQVISGYFDDAHRGLQRRAADVGQTSPALKKKQDRVDQQIKWS